MPGKESGGVIVIIMLASVPLTLSTMHRGELNLPYNLRG